MPSIERNVLTPLGQLSRETAVTPLHHLYQQSYVVNPRSAENGPLEQANYDWFCQGQGFVEAPDSATSLQQFEAMLGFGDVYRDSGASLRNLLLQLYSLHRVTSLFEQGDFDVAVFARPDLEYHDALPENALLYAARHPKACVVPNWQSWGGCNDRFAICGREAASAYGHRLAEAYDFCAKEAQPLHPERLLQAVIRKNQLQLRTMRARASRVRITGARKEEDFGIFQSSHTGLLGKLRLAYLEALSALM